MITPGKALVVGKFFYTSAYFHCSIRCVRLQLAREITENEAIGDSDFRNLALVMDHINEDIFSDRQRALVRIEVFHLLKSEARIKKAPDSHPDIPVWVKNNKSKNSRKHSPQYEHFMSSCLNFWLPVQDGT